MWISPSETRIFHPSKSMRISPSPIWWFFTIRGEQKSYCGPGFTLYKSAFTVINYHQLLVVQRDIKPSIHQLTDPNGKVSQVSGGAQDLAPKYGAMGPETIQWISGLIVWYDVDEASRQRQDHQSKECECVKSLVPNYINNIYIIYIYIIYTIYIIYIIYKKTKIHWVHWDYESQTSSWPPASRSRKCPAAQQQIPSFHRTS